MSVKLLSCKLLVKKEMCNVVCMCVRVTCHLGHVKNSFFDFIKDWCEKAGGPCFFKASLIKNGINQFLKSIIRVSNQCTICQEDVLELSFFPFP